MNFYTGSGTTPVEVSPGVKRAIRAHGGGLMLVEVWFEKGAKAAVHTHPHEQATYVMEGRLKLTVEGEDVVLEKGDSIYIPPEAPHSAEALEATRLLDVFSPQREDFL
ncbi:Cupin 2 conserved barrel domain protein [Spirochaeta thermophila DSM 6578]|uniref:Cupin 2 conserved barrel domain protein n=1 Tax=Winmispira thermophila (strain ATCC 700085 / DSM 6578 / Z-1203) TaxID=869211 RepID=G0GAD0_WINT7|nr:cupin domain-containing protein [Spirochaeta thermophila]AEJ61749.1 Cupin 2 conserved barrel domain protein [Spirochaeta thermophila DSM 6578]